MYNKHNYYNFKRVYKKLIDYYIKKFFKRFRKYIYYYSKYLINQIHRYKLYD